MNERDTEITAPQVVGVLLLALIIIMAIIAMVTRATTSQLRDLQRRVGQLEMERR